MILSRLSARLKFFLERWFQRSVWHQVLAMASLVVVVAVIGGITVWAFGDEFEGLGAAIWWSFLRLTDPGYLGDDEGALMRTVSTVVTVLGYVLFMGSLIAIMTQWLARTMRRLESGTTPIAINDHILILGWTTRTPAIVEQIVSSRGRLKRFLRQRGRNTLKIVILAEEVTLELSQLLRDRIGRQLADATIIFRSGSSLKVEHLRRVDLGHAAAVIVPGADFEAGGWELADTRVIKTLMSIANFVKRSDLEFKPSIVAELFDSDKMPVAESIMPGHLEIVASGDVVGGMIAQAIRNPGLSRVYAHLFSMSEPEFLFIRSCPELAGQGVLGSLSAFPEAIPIGVIRHKDDGKPSFQMSVDQVVEPEDSLVFVARNYSDCLPASNPERSIPVPREPGGARKASSHRVLILGWSHKIVSLLREFSGYTSESFEIEVISRVDVGSRKVELEMSNYDRSRIKLQNKEGDYTFTSLIESIELGQYDSILFLASDIMETAEQADARTVLGYALVKDHLRKLKCSPQLILELMDSENAHLFEEEEAETVISPAVLSHLLAHIALRRELSVVFRELFGPAGPDIVLRKVNEYGLGESMRFVDLQLAGAARGEIVLGYSRSVRGSDRGVVRLNPPRENMIDLDVADKLIVLSSPQA